jgi:hypothetical protein
VDRLSGYLAVTLTSNRFQSGEPFQDRRKLYTTDPPIDVPPSPVYLLPISDRFVTSSGRCRMHCAITEDRQQSFRLQFMQA